MPHQPGEAKVQDYILHAERKWEKRGRQKRVQLPEVAVVLGDASTAAFRQSRYGGQKGGGEWEMT